MTELHMCCRRFLGEAPRFFRKRLEAQLALFERVAGVPGDIVELGVGSGVALRGWLHLVAEHGQGRTIWGYDTFAGFPRLLPEDGPEAPALGKRVGGETECRDRPVTCQEVEASLPAHAGVRVELVAGDIVETLRAPRRPLALVFCDADTYAPTKAALDLLWPHLAPGGLIVFDEYGQEPWPGETRAVDEWLVANPGQSLERLSMESGPEAFVVKRREK